MNLIVNFPFFFIKNLRFYGEGTNRPLVCTLFLPSLTLQAVAESHRIGCWGCWTCPFKDGITTGWDIPTQEIDLLRLYFMTDAMQCQRLTVAVNKHFRRFVLKKERILFFIYKSVRRTPQIKFPPSSRVSPTAVPPLHSLREPTASAPRGATLGTRINRDISLIMSPSFVCQLRTQTAQSDGTNRQARRSLFSPPCGSCSVCE